MGVHVEETGKLAMNSLMRSLGRALIPAVVLSLGSAHAAEWKFNNGLPEGRNESKQLDQFAADVAELSGGSLSVKVFH
jgi:TRAP-type C4-dicarboxylate transport system substrate-binding protein